MVELRFISIIHKINLYPKMNSFLKIIFFILLLVIIWNLFHLKDFLFNYLQIFSPAQWLAWVLVGLISMTTAYIITTAVRSHADSQVKVELIHRRLDLYENFILLWHSIQSIEDVEKISSLQLQANELKSSMALVASAEVLRNLNRLLDQAAQGGPQSAQKIYEELLLSMRRDLHLPVLYPLPKELNKLFANLHNER